MVNSHYDVIIIGTGAGGGTLARSLAASGKKILILERGDFLPREKANWDSSELISKRRYRTTEIWYDKNGKNIHPETHYFVGGNTKFYGGALFRLREKDFEQVVHQGGISPEWPLKYSDFAPYYDQAEQLYEVRGQRGLDPTEPSCSNAYPFTAIPHEPYIQAIHDALKNKNLHPFYLPLGIKLNSTGTFFSECIRCNTCDGFPCLANAKADADINAVRPAIANQNVTLITRAKVLQLHTNPSGNCVTKVETDVAGERQFFSGDIIVVACGAVNSAILLLKSASDSHPNGLANSSNLVGRNYMAHKYGVVVALYNRANPTIFQKTLGLNDFYWGDKDFPYPMGSVQLLGSVHKEKINSEGPPLTLPIVAEKVARNSVAWLLMTEDLPNFNNRIHLRGEKIYLDYTDNNDKAFNLLIKRWLEVLPLIDRDLQRFALYFAQKMTIKEVAHQCGTCCFGEDPKTSVLNLDCRAHDIDNLYVVDASFFPSISAVNPSLTIMANALRVGEHLLQRLK